MSWEAYLHVWRCVRVRVRVREAYLHVWQRIKGSSSMGEENAGHGTSNGSGGSGSAGLTLTLIGSAGQGTELDPIATAQPPLIAASFT